MIKNFSEMSQRVTLFIHDKVYDQYGGYIINWKEYIKIWAKQEFVEEDVKDKKYGLKRELLCKFTTRCIKDICLPLKLQYRSKNFFVKKIKQLNQYMVLFCKIEDEK